MKHPLSFKLNGFKLFGAGEWSLYGLDVLRTF